MTINRKQDISLPVTLGDTLIPLDANGFYVPNHLDKNGTVHWFSVVDVSYKEDYSDLAHELRYFRAAHHDDGRLIHDSYAVMPVENPSLSPFPIPQLQMMLEDGELEEAQELAHLVARQHNLPFPQPSELPELRTGGEHHFDDEMDTKPFTPVQTDAHKAVEQFNMRFSSAAYPPLEPLDPTVNYAFEYVATDHQTLELAATKWWLSDAGELEHDRQALKTYTMISLEDERSHGQDMAARDRAALHHTYDEAGLEAAMRQAEAMAVANGKLDPNRADGRLFQQGPPDRFATMREAELSGVTAPFIEASIRDITNDDTQPMYPVVPAPGSWDELIAQQTGVEPEPERHYWQVHYRPVQTPEGAPLGVALFVTEFPQLPPDFDDYIEENGLDDTIYPTEARTLEIAHFSNEADARQFGAEFRSYLVPGLLEGPELAPELAKLEGMSGQWEAMDYYAIADYWGGDRTIVREKSGWHLHNSSAEREVQEQLVTPKSDIDF